MTLNFLYRYNKLKFELHIGNICQKKNRKLDALARMTNYVELPERRILVDALSKAQFNYCCIVWMCHSHPLNNKINRLYERCLRINYNDKRSNSLTNY